MPRLREAPGDVVDVLPVVWAAAPVTPYYSDDAVTIYHGDARDLLPSLRADVLVTDPPYGTGAYATDIDPTDSLVGWIRRFRSAAVMGWPENLVGLCIAAAMVPTEWATWWPSNAEVKGRFAPVPLARETEHIAFFGSVRVARGAPAGEPKHYIGSNQRANHSISPEGKRWGDVWRDASPGLGFQSHLRLHPNEKPVELMRRVLAVVDDGIVIDPFAGSGTTLRAAKDLGRKAIGIEREERWCEAAATRCRQEVLGLAG